MGYLFAKLQNTASYHSVISRVITMSCAIVTPAVGLAGSSLVGRKINAKQSSPTAAVSRTISCSGKIKKGINKAVKDGAPNTGVSKAMNKKGWVDSQGRKGKGYGVYRYADKYGANVDGYSPIYSPNEWAETGGTYKPGKNGLVVWAGLLAGGLGFAAFLIFSTSAL